MSHKPHLSIVAPCYNEQAVLPEFCGRVSSVCARVGRSYEIVLVNDGSRDDTWGVMEELACTDPHLVLVNLSRNHGHQLALTAGLSCCRGEWILIVDADLQDPPELLPEMLRLAEEGADVVYGQRRVRHGETAFKLFTAWAFYRLIDSLSNVRIPRETGDFRLISRRALEVLMRMPERHRFIRGMVAWIGFRQVPLEYDRDARFAGESKYPFWKMLAFALDAITSFSTKPLAAASYLGLISGVIGIGILIYALVGWLFFDVVSGWTSVLAAVAILGSTQLFVLGIIGEYLGRLYEETKSRPMFIIDRVVRADEVAPESDEGALAVTLLESIADATATALGSESF